MRLPTRTALLALVLLAPPALAQEAAQLTLTVLDQTTGAPVRDARVEVPGRIAVHTNRSGVARITGVPAGNRIVQITRLGYAPGRLAIEFPAGAAVEQTVRLASEAVAVSGVQVRTDRPNRVLDRQGFYRRQRQGLGAFMTAEVIDDIRPSRTIELFRYLRGFMVGVDGRGNPYVSTTRGTSGLASCTQPLVFMDGMVITSRSVSMTTALDMVPPENIEAIEAFTGPASIPVEYNPTGSACGVVLIWTKTGSGA